MTGRNHCTPLGEVGEDGEVFIRAKDPAYTNPGPDEAQNFEKVALE